LDELADETADQQIAQCSQDRQNYQGPALLEKPRP